MTTLPLYRPLSGRRIALALVVSIALHGAAVAVASLRRSEPAAQILFDASDRTFVFVEPEAAADPAPPPAPIPPLPPAQPNDPPPLFLEPAPAPTAIPRHPKPRFAARLTPNPRPPKTPPMRASSHSSRRAPSIRTKRAIAASLATAWFA